MPRKFGTGSAGGKMPTKSFKIAQPRALAQPRVTKVFRQKPSRKKELKTGISFGATNERYFGAPEVED